MTDKDLADLKTQFLYASKDRTPEIIIDPRIGLVLIKQIEQLKIHIKDLVIERDATAGINKQMWEGYGDYWGKSPGVKKLKDRIDDLTATLKLNAEAAIKANEYEKELRKKYGQ